MRLAVSELDHKGSHEGVCSSQVPHFSALQFDVDGISRVQVENPTQEATQQIIATWSSLILHTRPSVAPTGVPVRHNVKTQPRKPSIPRAMW